MEQIREALKDANAARDQAFAHKDELDTHKNSIREFEAEIYGEWDDKRQHRITLGWKEKIENELKEKENKIDNLLVGATNAGLAQSFQKYEDDFKKEVRDNSLLFYGSLSIIILTALGSYGLKPPSDIESFLYFLLFRIPLILPIVWLALVFSKRRSEFFRLQQEYSHKLSITRSYKSFSDQIEKLGAVDDNQLRQKLMLTAIESIAFNAANTLDKKHGDSTLSKEVIENVVRHVMEQTSK